MSSHRIDDAYNVAAVADDYSHCGWFDADVVVVDVGLLCHLGAVFYSKTMMTMRTRMNRCCHHR